MPVAFGQQDTISVSETETESTRQFVDKLVGFVQEVQQERHRSAAYWQQIDKLWKAMMERKSRLETAFSRRQAATIRRWTKKYHKLRNKRNGLS